jgi:hypothetical protein
LIKDLGDPFKRFLLMEAVQYTHKADDRIIEYLHDVFLEQISNLFDGVGTALVNIQLPRGRKIRSLFQRRPKREKKTSKTWKTPFGEFETY